MTAWRRHPGWGRALLALAPGAVFALGFLGRPEESHWLNRSPLWGRGDPFYSDADRRFVASPTLIWRGRPHHAGRTVYEFGGVENGFVHNSLGLRDDEPAREPGTVRVVNLGDSATWGLNLARRAESYSDQLERRLASGGGGFDVVNAGTIGYSSLQGERWLALFGPALAPDVVTVYIGNNDSAPAGMPDSERVPARFPRLFDHLSRNVFYLLAQKGLLALQDEEIRARSARFEEELRGEAGGAAPRRSKAEFYELFARVPPARHEENLRAIVRGSRERGARVLLLKVPMNLLWPPVNRPALVNALPRDGFWLPLQIRPRYLARAQRNGKRPAEESFDGHPYLSRITIAEARAHLASQQRDLEQEIAALGRRAADGAASARERGRALHDLGVWKLIQRSPADALARLDAAEAVAAADAGALAPFERALVAYARGIARFDGGDADGAFAELRRARALWPFAMSPDYEEAFDRAAAEPGVEWIDLPALFAAADPRFRGSALLHDWVHPDADGCRVIAEAIAQRIEGGR